MCQQAICLLQLHLSEQLKVYVKPLLFTAYILLYLQQVESTPTTRKYHLISELKLGKQNWSLKLRCVRKWDAINFWTKKANGINLIFVDEMHDLIYTTLRDYNMKRFGPCIEEGKIYLFGNLKVDMAPKEYNPVENDIVLKFNHDTKVKEEPNTITIPKNRFNLIDFNDLPARECRRPKFLTDVIGTLDAISPYQRVGKSEEFLTKDIRLSNIRKETIQISLWEKEANLFDALFNDGMPSRVVLTVTCCTVNYFGNKLQLNSTRSTAFYVNLNTQENKELLAMLEKDNLKECKRIEPVKKPNLNKEKIQNEMTIIQILNAQLPDNEEELICTCTATITDVLTNSGWSYTTCTNHNKKCTIVDRKMFCDICNTYPNVFLQRYRVKVTVQDEKEATTFVLFDRAMEQLINISAQTLSEKQASGQCDVSSIFNTIVGTKFVFQIKISRKYNINEGVEEYTVMRILTEKELQKAQEDISQDQATIIDASAEGKEQQTRDKSTSSPKASCPAPQSEEKMCATAGTSKKRTDISLPAASPSCTTAANSKKRMKK